MEQQEIRIELPANKKQINSKKEQTSTPKKQSRIDKLCYDFLKYKKNAVLFKRDVFRLISFNALGFFWGNGEILQIFNPLGIAYVSLFFGEGIFFYTVLCSVALGSFSLSPLKLGAIFSSALALELTLGKDLHPDDTGKKSLLAGFSMFLAGLFYAIASGGLTFYYIVAFIESFLVVTISYLAQKGISIFWSKEENYILTKEEVLGFLFLFSGAFVGLSNLNKPIFSEAMLSFMCSYFIIVSAYIEGMSGGSCAGLILGFLLYLCGGISSEIFALFGISGLLTGAIKELKKLPMAILSVSLPLLLTLYLDRNLFTELWLQGWVFGNLVFFLTPKKFLILFQGQSFTQDNSRNTYIKKKRLIEQKLSDFSKAFYVLGKTFKPSLHVVEKKDVVKMVDKIAENTCSGCGIAHYCWEEDLYRSYGTTVSAISLCDEKGKISLSDMPEDFRKSCVRGELYVSEINKSYNALRRDKVWIGRLEECRTLVGSQMEAVGDLLQELSGTIETPCIFLDKISDTLRTKLLKDGINVQDVQVIEEENGRIRVELIVKSCGSNGDCQKRYINLIKECTEKQMILKEQCACHNSSKGECTLIYTEVPSYQLTATSVSSSAKGDTSGDTTGFLQTDDGVALMAISDGMGQGISASNESLTAIELLEQFSEAGFSRELAVKMINSALLLKRQEESFATLDICAVDLFLGKAHFIKLGAVSSYVYRGERLFTITSHTLPAGILDNIEVIEKELTLKDNDIIIMVTDGITEAIGDENTTGGFIKEKLQEKPMGNPEDIAVWLMDCVKASGGNKDDMTIAVGKFWKKR